MAGAAPTGYPDMEIVFVDPEPPDRAGGGIRSYLRLALDACRLQGIAAKVYTHNPEAYPGENASPIGRKAWLRWPWRGLAYRLGYSQNVLWEQAYWLGAELEACDAPAKVYEFADFLGYGYFALKNPTLRQRIVLRVHTPDFLVNGPARKARGLRGWLTFGLGHWRESQCLNLAANITVPSAEFVKEKLPGLRNWVHIPNPLPPDSPPPTSIALGLDHNPGPARFLYLGRVEPRKGVLPMVRAFLRLAESRPEITLTLVGGAVSGTYAETVRALIDSQPPHIRARLVWEPPCPASQRPALFARFNTLVVPSLWENSPYVFFEGMAAGLLCVGSATGEMKAVAAITKSPMAIPGDEDDWLRVLEEVSSGAGREALPAQSAYLRKRRPEIPGQLLDYFRNLAGR